MLNLPVLIDDLLKITNQFFKYDLEATFFQSKVIKFGFKFKKAKYDFCLNFQDNSLISAIDNLDELADKILERSECWSNAKLDRNYEILSFNNQKATLTFNFDKSDFLIRIFKSEYNLSSLLDDQSINLLNNICVITIKDEDEWTDLRIRSFQNCLVNILEKSTNHSPLLFTQSTDLTDRNLEEFDKIYLIQSVSSKFKLSNPFDKKLKVLRIARVLCDLTVSDYKLKLKKEFDQFKEATIDELIKLKLLSYQPSHQFQIDFEYKQIVFLHYNHARLLVLIEKCSKIFESEFDLKDDFLNNLNLANNQNESKSNHLSRDLNDYTFNDHFISLSSFLCEFRLDKLDKLPLKTTYQLVYLCNDFSRYYQKKKVLDYSSFTDLICFKINLLKSVLSLMNFYFNILNIKPLDSI